GKEYNRRRLVADTSSQRVMCVQETSEGTQSANVNPKEKLAEAAMRINEMNIAPNSDNGNGRHFAQKLRSSTAFLEQSGSSPTDALEWAREYKNRGWQPVPIPRGEKAPNSPNWNTRIYEDEELPKHFRSDNNVGLLLGKPSEGLVDIDLDCYEARIVAS